MSARPSAGKRLRNNLSPTTTLNVMNSNSNSGMNSNSNAGITFPPVKRAKPIREANTQPTPIPLRTAAVGAANNIRMKAKANANNKTITNVRSVPRVNSQPKSLRRSTRVKNIRGGTGRATPARAPSIRKGVMKKSRVTSSAIKNAKLLMNVSRQAAAEKAATINAKANAKEKGNANDVERRKKSPVMNLKAKRKAAAIAQDAVNTKVAANKVNANARAKVAANKVNANARAKAAANKVNANARAKVAANKVNANARAKVAANKVNANARAKVAANARAATPANSARNSVTNIGNGGNSLNNNAISSAFIAPAERENGADGKLEKQDDGKLMKRGILLTIIKMAQRTSAMSTKNLKKLMPMVNNVNSITEYHTYAWALLYDMISTLENTKFTQIQITSKTLKDIHKKLMVKNAYTTGRTSTSGGMGNRREQVFNFTDEEVVEFLFLIWLDGNHDDYIHKSFIEWLGDKNSNSIYFTNKHRALAKKFVNNFPDPRKYINNVPKFPQNVGKKKEERKKFKMEVLKNVKGYDTIRKICIETDSVWFFIHDYNGDPSRVNTKNQTSVKMGFGTSSSKPPAKTSLAGNFESDLKMGIEKILNIKQSDFIFTGSREINNLKRNGIHEVSLDMETDDMILSRTITNTPSFRPYVTTANLIDPGKYMLSIGAGSDDRTLLLNAMRTQNIQILDNLQSHYHIGPVKFVIRNSNLDFLKVDLSIRKGGPPKTNNGRMPTLDFFDLKINESYIKQGEKKKGTINPSTKMGKFMGDALQYMTVAVQNTYRGKPRYFASGDGSACFMNAYFCQKLKLPIRLIIDTGISDIRTIGLRTN